jgi:superfamily II DNA or RNA helicase
MINARPTKSKARYIQGIGRSLRYLPGKTALIFDHSGTTLDLGFPEDIDIHELSTGKDPKEGSRKSSDDEKTEKKPKLCPKCDYLKEVGVYSCPKCGFAPIMGIDTDVDESRELTRITGKKKVYTKDDKQAFYSGLLGYQKERFMSGVTCNDGYISHLYRAKFDVWPKGLDKRASTPSPAVLGFIKSRRIAFIKTQNKLLS